MTSQEITVPIPTRGQAGQPPAIGPSPVFVDSSGRRRRVLLGIAYGLSGICFLYGALVSVSLALAPSNPHSARAFPDLAPWPEPAVSRSVPAPQLAAGTRRISRQQYAPAPGYTDQRGAGQTGWSGPDDDGDWRWHRWNRPAEPPVGGPDAPAHGPTIPTPTPLPSHGQQLNGPTEPAGATRRVRDLPLARSVPGRTRKPGPSAADRAKKHRAAAESAAPCPTP